MRMRYGVNLDLEEEANSLLRTSMRGVRAADHDILTPWKEKDRRRHEIYVKSGTPDPSVRSGMFYRALNVKYPELNSRDGVARGRPADGNIGYRPVPICGYLGSLAEHVSPGGDPDSAPEPVWVSDDDD